ncbi:MAG: hypothetical protein ABW136_09965 [Steroidobacteraceae bacterium]
MPTLILQDAPNGPGLTRVGLYSVEDGVVTVVHLGDFPSAMTQLDHVSVETIAQQILGEFRLRPAHSSRPRAATGHGSARK